MSDVQRNSEFNRFQFYSGCCYLSMQFFRCQNELPFNEGTFPFSMKSTQGRILQFNLFSVDQLLGLIMVPWLWIASQCAIHEIGRRLKTEINYEVSSSALTELLNLSSLLLLWESKFESRLCQIGKAKLDFPKAPRLIIKMQIHPKRYASNFSLYLTFIRSQTSLCAY